MRPDRTALKLQTTTLWYYPSQQHGDEAMGDPHYTGRTPTYVIWNLLERYTREGDLVVDPFCGGGTSIDVAHSMGRAVRGFDVAPHRDDIEQADARKLPLDAGEVDFIFMDPPYSTHIEYSNHPDCLGKLDAAGGEYYPAMAKVFTEAHRVLRNRRYLGLYVSDSYRKQVGFMGIGFELYGLLSKHFKPVDHIAVARGNRKLEKPRHHKSAALENSYLRGFNHLLIFKKED